jgi:hypothetical protein
MFYKRAPGSGSRRTQKVQSRKRIEILPIYGGQPIDWQTKALKKAYRS